eukprot:TRINITY_DN6462_c0_g1_i1.p1 TRINITY_DN6462_c0_g1~~TRINITY_DN6462_c0_g1_i1.p1  ORF type:complete len:538 (-),score=185.82 TRINITY_DN6462_c0_g1_i1:166-1779(-)
MGCGSAKPVQSSTVIEVEKYKTEGKNGNPPPKSSPTQPNASPSRNEAGADGSSLVTEILPNDQEVEEGKPPVRASSFCNPETNTMSRLAAVTNQRESEEREEDRRRSLVMKGKDEDEQLMDELFMFGDFAVSVPKPAVPKKKKVEPELQLVEGDLEEQIVKDYLEKKYFQFSDFCINLEEQILNPDGVPSGGPPTNDVEAYRFAFGDFGVGVTADQMKANNAVVQKGQQKKILNYSMYNLLGHSTRVKCICLSPNERFYVSSSAKDATIVMYDLRSGREFLYFDGHEDTIIGAHFSNDGKHLATASRDNTLILWDTVIGKQIFVFEHERIVICCCFSRDGKYIVSGCQDKVCRVWSTKKGKELLAFKEHEGIITAVSYSPDGENVVSASSDRTLKIWSSTTGVCSNTIQQHTGIVMACMYSIDGSYIVSNDEKIINVWDVKKSKVSLSLPVDQVPYQGNYDGSKKRTWTICSCCPGPFCYYIVAACSDRNVYILHPVSGEVVLSFFCKAAVYCLSSGLRNTLALGDAFGNIYAITLR